MPSRWPTVASAEDWPAASALLKTFTDGGAIDKEHVHWKSEAGGGRARRHYRCFAHVDCAVRVLWCLCCGKWELRREPGTQHSTAIEDYDRTNASLTREQKVQLREAVKWGHGAGKALDECEQKAMEHGATFNTGQNVGLAGKATPGNGAACDL